MLAIIDGDVLCYHACSPRWEFAIDDEGKPVFDEDGNQKRFVYTKAQDRYYLEKSWESFKKKLKEILDKVYATDYVMAVKSSTNFRDDMYPEYKQQRKTKTYEPQSFNIVPNLRKLAVAEGIAIESIDREADDFIRIWAEEAKAAGTKYVICSIDKDLKCIPGIHYNLKHHKRFTMTEEDSLRFYYEQLLKGDPTDNIPGLPGIGDVTATKLLSELNTEAEYQELVVGSYISQYGDEWRDYLLSNGKMIYIQQKIDKYFDFSDWPIVAEL